MENCKITSCNKPFLARGLCNRHYKEAQLDGSIAVAPYLSYRHKLSNHELYHTWENMRQRCNNPNNTGYKWYGGRGIQICKRWNDFSKFLADVGERPKGMTLDRINGNGNYEPNNVRWVTQAEQIHNTGLGVRNKTGYKGVWYNKKVRNYQAKIVVNSKQMYLGSFYSLDAAITARKKAEKKYWC